MFKYLSLPLIINNPPDHRIFMDSKIKAIALPKRVGWPILIFLVFWDAFLTYRAGSEGNPLWRPVVDAFGLNALWVLAAAVLALFYLLVKALGRYVERYEQFPQGEEIILTNLVIAFGAYDLYITFLLPYFGYLGTRSHYAIIPVIAVPVVVYNIWLERQKRKKN